jgi:hypothetical protein
MFLAKCDEGFSVKSSEDKNMGLGLIYDPLGTSGANVNRQQLLG